MDKIRELFIVYLCFTRTHLKNVFWPPAFGGIGASLSRVAGFHV
jgi:hypothetical protein